MQGSTTAYLLVSSPFLPQWAGGARSGLQCVGPVAWLL